MRTILAISAAAFMLLAGCSGSNDSGSNTDTQTSDPSNTGTTTTDGTTGGSGVMVWKEVPVTGSFQSVPGGASGATGAAVTLNVPENATEVWFNVTIVPTAPSTPASEFGLSFNDSDHLQPTDEAQETGSTSAGKFSVLVSEPLTGEWRMYIFSEFAPNAGSYEVRVNSYLPG